MKKEPFNDMFRSKSKSLTCFYNLQSERRDLNPIQPYLIVRIRKHLPIGKEVFSRSIKKKIFQTF